MRSMIVSVGLCCGVLLAVAGCSGSEVRPIPQRLVKMGYQQQPPVEVVHNYSVEGWHGLDDRHIIIETGTTTDYLSSPWPRTAPACMRPRPSASPRPTAT
ncbi:MAG: DUF6491 family protein [Nevskiales bacterium]